MSKSKISAAHLIGPSPLAGEGFAGGATCEIRDGEDDEIGEHLGEAERGSTKNHLALLPAEAVVEADPVDICA